MTISVCMMTAISALLSNFSHYSHTMKSQSQLSLFHEQILKANLPYGTQYYKMEIIECHDGIILSGEKHVFLLFHPFYLSLNFILHRVIENLVEFPLHNQNSLGAETREDEENYNEDDTRQRQGDDSCTALEREMH